MARDSSDFDQDTSLMIRAAWLHYVGGMTQASVAKRLGIPGVKAHRLIARANQDGAIKVTVDGDIAECVMLEQRLAKAFGLDQCEVTPDLHEIGLPIRALGMSGAAFLRSEIASGQNAVIGIGHGRTLAAAVRQLPRFDAQGTQFVSLLGGLTRNYAANPHDVMHRLAEKTSAPAFVMPVPMFANTVEDREVLLSQRGVREVFDLARRSDLKVVGIGTVESRASLVASGIVSEAEIADVKAKGGVGEIMGHFFDAAGRVLDTPLTARALSCGLPDKGTTRIVAIAGGEEKASAVRSVLMSGHLTGLITDERTAIALVGTD